MLAQRQSVNSEPCRLLPVHRGHIRVEWSCLDRRAWVSNAAQMAVMDYSVLR